MNSDLPKDLDPKLLAEEERIAKEWKDAEEGRRNFFEKMVELGKQLLKNEDK